MTPEEKKNLEEYKKKNAEAVAANAKIANLNATLTAGARGDRRRATTTRRLTSMKDATTQKPDEGILWVTLGDAQLGRRTRRRRRPATRKTSAERSGDHAEVHGRSGLVPEGYRR